jgi:hypothetical protein
VAAGPDALIAELEQTVHELGAAAWSADRDWCLDRLSEFYEGGAEALDELGSDQLLAAELWYLLDCPLPDGETALWRLGHYAPSRAAELLARSELRAWRVESIEGAQMLGVLCPLGTGRARIELSCEPIGEVVRGAFVVARSVPLGPQLWGLIGPAAVVERPAAADFEALLAALDAPLGELWRVHGGVLARAAWGWPDRRECTLEGRVVQWTVGTFGCGDPAAAIAALEADPELQRSDREDIQPRWRWHWPQPAARTPAPVPGVSFELAAEEAGPDSCLAEVRTGVSGGELAVCALTPARYKLAQRLLRDRLGSRLGELRSITIAERSALPRWRALGRGDGALGTAPAAPLASRAA